MILLRRLGNAVLTVLAVLGVASAALWAANAAGVVQPLIVVSGSMEPQIATGDLLIGRPAEPATIEVGEVITVRSELTGALVTHRVLTVDPIENADEPAGLWHITMQGDANAMPDLEIYEVGGGDELWRPVLTVPGAGGVVATLTRPGIAIPLLISIAALIAMSLLPAGPRSNQDPQQPEGSADDPAEPEASGTDRIREGVQ